MYPRKNLVGILVLLIVLLSIVAVAQAQDETTTHYVTAASTARVRSCPELTCTVVAHLDRGATLEVIETVHGGSFSGSSEWVHITLDGADAYIHGSLTSLTAPAHANTATTFHGDAHHTVSPHAPVNYHP